MPRTTAHIALLTAIAADARAAEIGNMTAELEEWDGTLLDADRSLDEIASNLRATHLDMTLVTAQQRKAHSTIMAAVKTAQAAVQKLGKEMREAAKHSDRLEQRTIAAEEKAMPQCKCCGQRMAPVRKRR